MESLSDLLSRHAHHIWTGRNPRPAGPHVSTGYRALDQALGGGWPTGALIEILTPGGGFGQVSLFLPVLATLTQAGMAIAWLPGANEAPYAPALQQAGVNLSRVLLTTAQDHHQRLWGAEQCLRSGTCGAVVLTEMRPIADPLLRRLKLAATAGGAIAFVLRKEAAAANPSPASIRLEVRSAPFALLQRQVTLLKGSNQPARTLALELRDYGRQP